MSATIRAEGPIAAELTGFFRAGVAAAHPAAVLPGRLPQGAAPGRTLVLGCGKAAAAMAEVAAATLAGAVSGCVVTRHGHGALGDTGAIEVIEASHPVPDARARAAGQCIRSRAESVRPGDRVIFLISGGGSALLCDPIPGLPLAEKAAITAHLVTSGAPITAINLARRHLSRVKGGRLAAAARQGDLHSFLISDVAGDDPAAIASGPTIAAAHDPEAALAILAGSGWPVSASLAAAIRAQPAPRVPDHPVHIVATGTTALSAIEAIATTAGWRVLRIGDHLTGEARTVGAAHAALAMSCAVREDRVLLLSGGELTVTVKAPGGGGPNLEYLAGMIAALPDNASVCALAADSDGIDGTQDNAGGWFDPRVAGRARHHVAAALAGNATHALFARLDSLVMTGPTRTNVNDIRMIAVLPPGQAAQG
jgi:glycerate-2-kinase